MLPDTEETLYVERRPRRTASHTLFRRGNGASASGLAGALHLGHAVRSIPEDGIFGREGRTPSRQEDVRALHVRFSG